MEPRVDINLGIEGEPDKWVHSACVLCSNGCGLEIAVKDDRIVGVRGDARHPVSFGHLGPKGENGWRANNDPHRGTTPMLRRRKGADLEPVSWEEAFAFCEEHFRRAWDQGHENLVWQRTAVSQPAHVVCARPGEPAAAVQVVAGDNPQGDVRLS